MARLELDGDTLVLALTGGEKVAALHGDVRVPRAAVTSVDVVEDPIAAIRGLRAPGLALPGRTMIGTWRGRGERRFVVARRGVPAVRVRLRSEHFDELLVSTDDARAVAESIGAGGA